MARPRSGYLNQFLGAPPRVRTLGATGKVTPVPKRSNPYVRPSAGGGTTPTGSPSTPDSPKDTTNLLGMLAQQRAAANKAPVSTAVNVSYESDPVLARIRALGSQNVANAQSEAAALRKQAIIDTGFADVGGEIGLDSATLEAARQNPFSTRATIDRTSAEQGHNLNEALNQQNLFYSGHRANQLQDLGTSTALAQTNALRDLRGVLGGVDQGVMGAQAAATAQEQETLNQIAADERAAALNQAFTDSLALALNPPAPAASDPALAAALDPAASMVAPAPVPAQTMWVIDPNTGVLKEVPVGYAINPGTGLGYS